MTIGDMAEQEKDMEIEKDQEAPGTEDRAEECAEAPEPEKGQQAGEGGRGRGRERGGSGGSRSQDLGGEACGQEAGQAGQESPGL